MKRLLERAGVTEKVLEYLPEVCDTCRVCREWQQPAPSNASNINIPDAFNQQVECDILFIWTKAVFHMLDRCTRWHATTVIPDKSEDSLITAINTLWVSTHGPMKELIVDGESGIVASDKCQSFLQRHGIKCHVRAKDQHARYVERRGELLRQTIHKMYSQLKEEAMNEIPFESVLAEATFAGNALLEVNGSSP